MVFEGAKFENIKRYREAAKSFIRDVIHNLICLIILSRVKPFLLWKSLKNSSEPIENCGKLILRKKNVASKLNPGARFGYMSM